MTDPDQDNRAFLELIAAAARFFDVAQLEYRERHPVDHAAFTTLLKSGRAVLYVGLTLPPALRVEIGFVVDGKPHPILAFPDAPAPSADAPPFGVTIN